MSKEPSPFLCRFFLSVVYILILWCSDGLASPFRVTIRQTRTQRTQSLDLEDYVLAVLASEALEPSPLAALQAQAIVIRSYALAERGRHAKAGFDFCDLTHCQNFRAPPARQEFWAQAVDSTRGWVLSYEGKVIPGFYHSSCGGATSPNQKVFGGKPLAYLQGVDDGDYCRNSPHQDWTARIPHRQLQKIFQQNFSLRGELKGLKILSRQGSQGRAYSLELQANQRVEVNAQAFVLALGRNLGWGEIKSAWFDVERQNDVWIFQGHGLGHGIGLCQWGAMGQARAGKNFKEILHYYFPGTQLKKVF